jgi:hypothetical protein
MPQDIKTFSQALDINPKLLVRFSYKIHGYVSGQVKFNGMNCEPDVVNTFVLDLLHTIHIASTISEFTEGISGVELSKLTVNDYEALPKYQHLTSHNTNYHDWVGELRLDINEPFYTWYHTATGQGWLA